MASLRALRGIRKAQAKLAAYYLLRQMTAPARRIFNDMALETTRFSRNQVMVQAGTAMLAQANQSSQSILKLLG